MIGVGGGPCGYGAQKISGNDYIRRGTADPFSGTFSEGIYAAWSHVAVSATEPQLTKTALWLLFVKSIPGSLQAGPLADVEHLPAGWIYRSITNILCHISTFMIYSKH
jgi:hypothetical protein